jgi:hypothetical protein
LKGIKNYKHNLDVFFELIRRQEEKGFTGEQWSMIGKMRVGQLSLDEIYKKFGKEFLAIGKKLAALGFDEYYKYGLTLLKEGE